MLQSSVKNTWLILKTATLGAYQCDSTENSAQIQMTKGEKFSLIYVWWNCRRVSYIAQSPVVNSGCSGKPPLNRWMVYTWYDLTGEISDLSIIMQSADYKADSDPLIRSLRYW